MGRLFIIGLIGFFAHHFAWAKTEVRYFKVGKNIEVRPPEDTTNPDRILWRLDGNYVAEWGKVDLEVHFYPAFKTRTKLDTNTGVLVISATTENDAGEYSVEINDIRLNDRIRFVSIEEVPEPTVWVKPGTTDDDRILSCEGGVTTKAEPVEYYWNIGLAENEPWTKSADDRFTLNNNETTQRIQFIYCKMVNPIGEKKSPPKDNPFYSSGISGGAVAGILLPILIFAVVGIVVFLKREEIKTLLRPKTEAAENGPARPGEVEGLNAAQDGGA